MQPEWSVNSGVYERAAGASAQQLATNALFRLRQDAIIKAALRHYEGTHNRPYQGTHTRGRRVGAAAINALLRLHYAAAMKALLRLH